MMPRRQAAGIQRKPRLPRQLPAECPATSKHGRSLRAQTDSLSQFFEVTTLQLFALQVGRYIACSQMCFLQGELSSARQYRHRVGNEGDISECKDAVIGRRL